MIRSAPLRIKQRMRRNSTSLPYLSGDGFAALVAANSQQIFFCKSEDVEENLERLGSLSNSFVLLAGNSDRDFVKDDFCLPHNLNRLYLQNSHISQNHLIRTLPIGVENLRHSMNGVPELLRSELVFSEKANKVLVGPFGNTHPQREELLGLSSSSSVVIVKDRLKIKSFAKFASGFKYVACPRGNGIDTHRVWETLYRGSLPIVLHNEWSRSLEYLGLPIIKVNSWSEDDLLSVVEKYSNFLPLPPSGLDFLWAENWKKLFLSELP